MENETEDITSGVLQLGGAKTYRQGFDEHTNVLSYIFHFKAWKLMMLAKKYWLFNSKIMSVNQLTVTALLI